VSEREREYSNRKKPYTFRRLLVTSYNDDLSLYIDKKNNNNIMNVEYVNMKECVIKIRMHSKQVSEMSFSFEKKRKVVFYCKYQCRIIWHSE